MRRSLFCALAIVGMLTSCSKEDVVDSNSDNMDNAIGFNTYKNLAKGNPVNSNAEFLTAGRSFGVMAFISTNNSPYMGTEKQGLEIKSNGTLWNYVNPNEQAFWPTKGESLDFYAYAPYTADSIRNLNFSKTDELTFNYAVVADEKKQVDLMYAVLKGQTKPARGTKVMLSFKHALTQVYFQIGTKTKQLKIDLDKNGITIHNIMSAGKFASPSPLPGANGWSAWAKPINYTVTSDPISAGYVGSPTPKYIPVGFADSALMLLPQIVTKATTCPGSVGSYLTIKCKIYQTLADGTAHYLVGTATTFENVYVPISSKTDAGEVWNQGKKVIYSLLIGGGAILDPIEFDASCSDWTDEAGGIFENN